MFYLFAGLSALCLLALITGLTWFSFSERYAHRLRRASAAPAPPIDEDEEDLDDEADSPPPPRGIAGKSREAENTASISFAEMKQGLQTGSWRHVFAPVVGTAGLLGLFAFGSLAIWVKLDNKLAGSIFVAIAWFVVAKAIRDFVHA